MTIYAILELHLQASDHPLALSSDMECHLQRIFFATDSWRSLTLRHDRRIYADWISATADTKEAAELQLRQWIRQSHPDLVVYLPGEPGATSP